MEKLRYIYRHYNVKEEMLSVEERHRYLATGIREETKVPPGDSRKTSWKKWLSR